MDYEKIIIAIPVLIIAIVGHEICHGLAAYFFKDDTAKNMGRLSINPLKHIDLLGSIVIPTALYLTAGVVFGWAKPVPVDFNKVLKNGGNFGAIIVSLAGIIYNLILAFICFFILMFILKNNLVVNKIFINILFIGFFTNIFLALFNLYPIPPLDGSKTVMFLFRWIRFDFGVKIMYSSEKYGMVLLMLCVAIPQVSRVFFSPIYGIIKSLLFN